MNDIINGCFEAGLVLMLILNIQRLFQDKEVKGVDWRCTAFVTLWGVWNMFYYPMLGQWFSMVAGAGVCLANMTWLGLMFYYIRNPGGRPTPELDGRAKWLARNLALGFMADQIAEKKIVDEYEKTFQSPEQKYV